MLNFSFCKFRWKTISLTVFSIYALSYIILNLGADTIDINTYQCPACYGDNVCPQLEDFSSKLVFPTNLKLFNIFFNAKNVFYIERFNVIYVAKKLAHDIELSQFGEALCKTAGFNLSCNEAEAMIKLTSIHHNNIADVVNRAPVLFENTDPIKCKQTTTIEHLYSQYKKLDSSKYSVQHFITLLAINPEPLIIQAKYKGLAVPSIFGMCGRLFIETYEGKRLTQFYEADWTDRAYLSLQLLRMALELSENNWKLFLLDVSPNNFAVDSSKIVKLVDAENIVILDATDVNLSETPYQNDGKGCPDCLSFTFEDLCSHKFNDHNYFAICKGILAPSSFSDEMTNGLLHDTPEYVMQRYPNFEDILQECSFPNKITRKTAAILLMNMLNNTIEMHN